MYQSSYPPFAPGPFSVPPMPPALSDRTVIQRFCESGPESCEKLNADFALQLDPARMADLQARYRAVLHRDPTVGELRVLDALRRTVVCPCAVGSFETDSPELAETWADMMQKHAALHTGAGTRADICETVIPPCTPEEALRLTERYILRTTAHPTDTRAVAVTDTTVREAEALLQGYKPIARILTDARRMLTVHAFRGAVQSGAIPRSGDALLYVEAIPLDALSAFIERERRKPTSAISAAIIVEHQSLLSAVASFCPAAELRTNRLIRDPAHITCGYLPLAVLCGLPTNTVGTVNLLVRTPASVAYALTEEWKQAGVMVNEIGHVKAGDRITLTVRDESDMWNIPVVDLPATWIRETEGLLLKKYAPRITEEPIAPITPSAIARLPGLYPYQQGITPDGREAVALTAAPENRIMIPEEGVYLCVASACAGTDGVGYRTAMDTVRVAVETLTAGGDITLRRGSPRLSVTLTRGADASDDLVLEAVCGLYRAAAERGLPICDPVLNSDPGVDGIRLSVTAYAESDCYAAQNQKKSREPSVEGWTFLSYPQDLQWNSGVREAHREPPHFLMPVTRRSREGGLLALRAALARTEGIICTIFPVAMDTLPLDPEVADISGTAMEQINPQAAVQLASALTEPSVPVFATSAEDARRLLTNPAIRTGLDEKLSGGYSFIVCGDACRAFAEYGYLPAVLAELTEIPAAGQDADVTYRIPIDISAPITRLVRRDLLTPKTPLPSLLTLTLPAGGTVLDGFLGCNGQVLGILNGVDAALVSLILMHTRGRFDV